MILVLLKRPPINSIYSYTTFKTNSISITALSNQFLTVFCYIFSYKQFFLLKCHITLRRCGQKRVTYYSNGPIGESSYSKIAIWDQIWQKLVILNIKSFFKLKKTLKIRSYSGKRQKIYKCFSSNDKNRESLVRK